MVLFRMLTMAVMGLGFVAVLARLTSWPFALYCYGVLGAGLAANQAGSTSPLYIPAWMSSAGGRLFLSLMAIFSFVSPVLVGLVWFRWWWGFAGYVLAGVGTALTVPIAPVVILRLFVGLTICVGSAIAMAR